MQQITEFKLTEDQAIALGKLKQFIAYPQGNLFRLTGYAGTGKSFVICQLIKWLQDSNYNFAVASPTNKAAKNLEHMARESGINLDALTVAKLLGQQAVINQKTGKEEFISMSNDDDVTYEDIIIDEFSMINKDNFFDLVEKVNLLSNTKLIFVGDPAQLPPVGEKESIINNHPDITNEANLTTVVRYDGELAKVAEIIRSDWKYNQVLYPFITAEDESIICLDRYEWLQEAVKLFQSEEFKTNNNYCRFLVWRNKQADILNAYVRKFLWGKEKDLPVYVPGDLLIAKVPVFRGITILSDRKKPIQKWNTVMSSSEECKVIKQGILTYDESYGWEHWQIPVITNDGAKLTLRILTDQGDRDQKEYLKKLKSKKQWKAYYHCLKSFDNVPYAYAITTHKAQGSGIDYAFVDTLDIKDCSDLQKIMYTALTRAKKQAFIPFD